MKKASGESYTRNDKNGWKVNRWHKAPATLHISSSWRVCVLILGKRFAEQPVRLHRSPLPFRPFFIFFFFLLSYNRSAFCPLPLFPTGRHNGLASYSSQTKTAPPRAGIRIVKRPGRSSFHFLYSTHVLRYCNIRGSSRGSWKPPVCAAKRVQTKVSPRSFLFPRRCLSFSQILHIGYIVVK